MGWKELHYGVVTDDVHRRENLRSDDAEAQAPSSE